ncbi:MAG: Crp/Fnr family transcriptional regulator [Bacteroidia bacterium]|nr:MAG: Crp/Fnr family transcriptional regulator [Bacteroidia bacterium]
MLIYELLRKMRIFSSLTNEELHDLRKNIFVKEYLKGDIIQREQSYAKAIPIVISGVTKIILVDRKDSKEVFLYYISEGSTSVTTISQGLFKESLSLRIEAETNCEIGYIPLEYFNLLLCKHPDIFQHLLEIYFNIFLDLINSMSNHVFNNIEEKIIFLLHYKSKVLKTNVIETTHEQIARELNSSREVITRALQDLMNDGKIEMEKKKIKLLDTFFNETATH